MKMRFISYMAVVIILLGVFETGIRLIVSSAASKYKIELAATADQDDDDATKERERTDDRVTKEYIPEIDYHLFAAPERNLKSAFPAYLSNFSYRVYSEVLTPPPNC